MKTKKIENEPVAVLISDIHFSLQNMEPASTALVAAQLAAAQHNVPLVIAGDLLDGKAILRAEVMNRLIRLCAGPYGRPIILCGNHDLVNEKGSEHALNFLRPYADVIDKPSGDLEISYIPYTGDSVEVKSLVESAQYNKVKFLVMHTGVQTAFMGHYTQDKSSLPPEAFDGLRVISGHYHRAQDIKCGENGLFSYIGSPYTMNFGEAEDGPKGFAILHSDGSLERIPLSLRKHIVVERGVEDVMLPILRYNAGDLLWLKVTGPFSELEKLDKKEIGQKLIGHSDFKLDKITEESTEVVTDKKRLTGAEMLDSMIDGLDETADQKEFLKKLWRSHEAA